MQVENKVKGPPFEREAQLWSSCEIGRTATYGRL